MTLGVPNPLAMSRLYSAFDDECFLIHARKTQFVEEDHWRFHEAECVVITQTEQHDEAAIHSSFSAEKLEQGNIMTWLEETVG